MRQYPQAFAESLNATDMLVNGISEVAIVGDRSTEAVAEILEELRQPFRPNLITAHAENDVTEHASIPLLSHRVTRAGKPTIYVCRNFACRMPVTTAAETAALLAEIL